MKRFLKFASIPLVLFLVVIGAPWLFAQLINDHSDIGIAAIVTLVCIAFGYLANKLYNFYMKVNSNENS